MNFNILISNLIILSFPFVLPHIQSIENSAWFSSQIYCHTWFNTKWILSSQIAVTFDTVSFLFSTSCMFLLKKSSKNISPPY